MFKEGQIEMAESQVVDNQCKLMFTLIDIGYSSVSDTQWLGLIMLCWGMKCL